MNNNYLQRTPATWGVCAVCIPRESYWWLEDWISHHIKAGASKITIYDNTGSAGSMRKSSVFCTGQFQKRQISKRGERYGELTSNLTDQDIMEHLLQISKQYTDIVEIVRWTPVNKITGEIVHGQVEAYVDFIRKYKGALDWCAFLDIDEYLYCCPGLTVQNVVAQLEQMQPPIGLLQLRGWKFECRWSPTGPKDILTLTSHRPLEWGGEKNMVRLNAASKANIHWDWQVHGQYARAMANPYDFGFCHYNQKPDALEAAVSEIIPRDFLHIPGDDSIKLRLGKPFAQIGAELVAPLAIDEQ